MENLTAAQSSFKRVLELHPVVPQLQRNYSWTQQEWSDLWQDLIEFVGDEKLADRPYFIGTIVLERSGKQNRILDGQQRLATLTILLGALTFRLRAFSEPDAVMYEMEGIRHPRRPDERFLTLNQYDERFFRDFVQLRKYDTAPKYESHRLIKKAHLYFLKKIDEAAEGRGDGEVWLKTLCDAIVDHFTFVNVICAPDDSYQVFRVLNDRGKNLSQLDLFRTYLLDRVGDERRDELADDWTEILDIQSPGNSLDLLRFYWVSKFGDVKAVRLARDIDRRIREKEITADQIAEDLFFYSDIYKRLVSPSIEAGFSQEEVNLLGSIQDYRAKALLPLLMKALYLRENSGGRFTNADFQRLLRIVVSIYVRHTVIGGLDNSRLESQVYAAAKDLTPDTVTDVTAKLRQFAAEKGLGDDWFKLRFAEVSEDKDIVAKAILRAIETKDYNLAERTIPTSAELHLEHIYPKNPREQHRIQSHGEYVSRLGNLTIVARRINQRMSNRPFSEKRDFYRQSQIGLTRSLAELEQWTADDIEARQKELAEFAVNVWPLQLS